MINKTKPGQDTDHEAIQTDHVKRMTVSDAQSHDYWINIMHRRYPVYIELINKYKSGNLMHDIGCGFAGVWYENYVKPSGYEYSCTDLTDEVVAYMENMLKTNGPGSYAKKGALESLPWPENSFDIVYASLILEHCQDIVKTFDEIRRVLKPTGILLFAVPCGYDDEPAHTHNRHLHEWREDFEQNGFKILESGQFDFNQDEFYGVAQPTN